MILQLLEELYLSSEKPRPFWRFSWTRVQHSGPALSVFNSNWRTINDNWFRIIRPDFFPSRLPEAFLAKTHVAIISRWIHLDVFHDIISIEMSIHLIGNISTVLYTPLIIIYFFRIRFYHYSVNKTLFIIKRSFKYVSL